MKKNFIALILAGTFVGPVYAFKLTESTILNVSSVSITSGLNVGGQLDVNTSRVQIASLTAVTNINLGGTIDVLPARVKVSSFSADTNLNLGGTLDVNSTRVKVSSLTAVTAIDLGKNFNVNTSRVLISSLTVGGVGGDVTISTQGAVFSSRACAPGYKRVSVNKCLDSDGVLNIIVTSAPVAETTVESSTAAVLLVGYGVQSVILRVHAQVLAGSGANPRTILYISALSANRLATVNDRWADADADIALDTKFDFNNVEVIVDGDVSFNYLVRSLTDTGSTHEGGIAVLGYYDGK